MRIIKKILNSSYKRVNTFFGSGFSVERSYGLKWLIDWSNRVDKKMTFKLLKMIKSRILSIIIKKI